MAELEELIRREFSSGRIQVDKCKSCEKEKIADLEEKIDRREQESDKDKREIHRLKEIIKRKDERIDQILEELGQIKIRVKACEGRRIENGRIAYQTKEREMLVLREENVTNRKEILRNHNDTDDVGRDDGETLEHVQTTGGLGIPESEQMSQSGDVSNINEPIINPIPEKLSEEEWEREKQERRERKRNVIVKGLTLILKNKKEELEEWAQKVLDLKIRVESRRKIERGWRVTLDNLNEKRELLQRRTSLNEKEWGVWIKNDLTERETEAWRKKGKNTRSGYCRIWIDDTCLI